MQWFFTPQPHITPVINTSSFSGVFASSPAEGPSCTLPNAHSPPRLCFTYAPYAPRHPAPWEVKSYCWHPKARDTSDPAQPRGCSTCPEPCGDSPGFPRLPTHSPIRGILGHQVPTVAAPWDLTEVSPYEEGVRKQPKSQTLTQIGLL